MDLPPWITREDLLDVLEPCPRCQRHVRPDGTACPFCGAETRWKARSRLVVHHRLSRGALWALGAALGAEVFVACSTSSGPVYGLPFDPLDAAPADARPDHLVIASDADPPDADATLPDAEAGDSSSADGGPVDAGPTDADAEP
jgi:hypothetical protein